MIDQIIEYNSLGWATFPVIATGPKAKTPACKDWASREPDPIQASLEEEAYIKAGAYGVVLRPQDLIVDVDPRAFQDDVNSWKKLREDLALGRVDAPSVMTGGGGVHIYFTKPADEATIFKVKGYPGVEIKSGGKGAYVIGPGSAHPSGTPYRWHPNGFSLSMVPPIPNKLWEKFKKLPAAEASEGSLDGGAQEYDRYVSWLDNQEAAVEGQAGDHETFKIAARGRDFGLPARLTLKAMLEHYNERCQPPWSEDELKRKIYNAYKYASGEAGHEDPTHSFESIDEEDAWDDESDAERRWDMGKDEAPKKTLRNAINYLYLSPDLRDTIKLNQFTGDIEMTGRVPWFDKRAPNVMWTDTDVVLLKYHLAKTKRIEFSTAMLWEALHAAAIRKAYHPIRNYIEELKWDGVSRLDSWLTNYCGARDNAYTQAVGRKTIIGMVARIFRPGVKFDYCTILEGAQGIGKSSVCAILGGQWYGDIVLDPHARDTVDAMRGKWVIELSEMEVTKRSDAQALKAFISRTHDRARLAYARTTLDFPRQCVFIGTINPDELGYLSDTTGNRRFWPVRCGDEINMDGLAGARDQIIAEAYAAYKGGESLYLQGDLAKLAEIEQYERMSDDPWLDVVSAWLESAPEIEKVTLNQVWEMALGGQPRSIARADQARIGRVLRDLGFKKHRVRTEGGRANSYTRDVVVAKERIKELMEGGE